MLIGQYQGKLGVKNRVAFPKKFREELGDKLIMTQGFEKTLIVVSQEKWGALLEGTEGKPFTVPAARDTQRFLLGGATLVELDEKGSFIIPQYLRDYAGLTDEIVFLGISRYVEVWDKKRWSDYNAKLSDNASTVAEKLSKEGNDK